MSRVTNLHKSAVEFIPEQGDPGVLYVSERFKTAMHLCCCGCGSEVITPLNPAKWQLIESGAGISIYPSIGNWSFPCRSHYWIRSGQVEWATSMSQPQVDMVRRIDELSASEHFDTQRNKKRSRVLRFVDWLKSLFASKPGN